MRAAGDQKCWAAAGPLKIEFRLTGDRYCTYVKKVANIWIWQVGSAGAVVSTAASQAFCVEIACSSHISMTSLTFSYHLLYVLCPKCVHSCPQKSVLSTQLIIVLRYCYSCAGPSCCLATGYVIQYCGSYGKNIISQFGVGGSITIHDFITSHPQRIFPRDE